jgi:sugar phosphate isomerase/epimerase
VSDWSTLSRTSRPQLERADQPAALDSSSPHQQTGSPSARLSVSGLTTIRWDLLQDVCGCRDSEFSSIGLWRPKVLEFGEDRAIELLRDSSLDVSSVSWVGGFTGTNGYSFHDSVWDARQAIRFAGEVGAGCVVVASGSRGTHTLNHARRLLLDALRELADDAAEVGVNLALQPMHQMFASDWTFLNTLDETTDILAMADHPQIGLAFDTYHLWQEPDLTARLSELVPLIEVVQVSDWHEPVRSRHDRLLPGDGIIPLAEIFECLIRGGYRGHYDLQVWSDQSWREDYPELIGRARRQFQDLLPRTPVAVAQPTR